MGHEDLDPETQTLLPDPGNAPASLKGAHTSRVLMWVLFGVFVLSLGTHLFRSRSYLSNYVPSIVSPFTEQCPSWFRAMEEEYLPWKEKGGIDRADVEAAQPFASARFQIINGSLYAEHFLPCWQTRARYSKWGLLMFLRHFGTRVPDIEFMFSCGDMPQIWERNIPKGPTKSATAPAPPPPPVPALFAYNRQEGTLDLTLPDWSFWGWPEVEITRWQDHGKKIMDAGREIGNWEDRKPKAFWKGATDVTSGVTEGLRMNLTACTADPSNGVEAYEKNWMKQSASMFNDTRQWEQCGWRYRIYAEGFAWSVSMKYGMACGSVMLVITPFFSAYYHPGLHYGNNALLIDRIPLCQSLRQQITWANEHPAEARVIAQAGLRFVEKDLSMERVYDYMLHKFTMYAALQKFTPSKRERSVLVTEDAILAEAPEFERERYLVKEPPSVGRKPCRM